MFWLLLSRNIDVVSYSTTVVVVVFVCRLSHPIVASQRVYWCVSCLRLRQPEVSSCCNLVVGYFIWDDVAIRLIVADWRYLSRCTYSLPFATALLVERCLWFTLFGKAFSSYILLFSIWGFLYCLQDLLPLILCRTFFPILIFCSLENRVQEHPLSLSKKLFLKKQSLTTIWIWFLVIARTCQTFIEEALEMCKIFEHSAKELI